MPAVTPIKPLPGTKYGPAILVVASCTFGFVNISAVVTYVQWQLQTSSRTYDRMFAQYQSPQSEASRQKVFEDQGSADPRRSVFNVLGWGK
ncbi:hypothetical protein diail_8258 [Diaporthe ilicicola]|nr:hypothetical protein diail_8258 [Diaporthe ilicicola]